MGKIENHGIKSLKTLHHLRFHSGSQRVNCDNLNGLPPSCALNFATVDETLECGNILLYSVVLTFESVDKIGSQSSGILVSFTMLRGFNQRNSTSDQLNNR